MIPTNYTPVRSTQQAPTPPTPPPADPAPAPAPAPPSDGSEVGAPKGDSFLYKATRGLAGLTAAAGAGIGGAVIGGVRHAADDISPDNKITKTAEKALKWGCAGLGAAIGVVAGLTALPLGPLAGLIAGPIIGAAIGGALPGAAEAGVASLAGSARGLIDGAKHGWHTATHLVDKLAHKTDPPKPDDPKPVDPKAPLTQLEQ